MQNFREDYLTPTNLTVRTVDFFCHLAAAFTITYLSGLRWYWGLCQWFPDIMLLFIWPHAMLTKRYLPDTNFFLLFHKLLHLTLLSTSVMLGCIITSVWFIFITSQAHIVLPVIIFFINWFVHDLIDEFTHDSTNLDMSKV